MKNAPSGGGALSGHWNTLRLKSFSRPQSFPASSNRASLSSLTRRRMLYCSAP
jgi:hypothetical protein